jgi:hypothetical protein
MYITEKHARLLSDEQWQEKLAAKEYELLKLTEKLTIQYTKPVTV